jgi:hypothetical protein
MKEIEIIIHPDGRVEMDVKAGSGPECEALTKDAEAALGRVVKRSRKPEFYQRATAKPGQRLQHG